MNFKNKILFLFTFLLFTTTVFAQDKTQTIRGTVLDKEAETPLIGVSVLLLSDTDPKGASTDIDGNFVIEGVTVGRQTLRFSYLGYQTVTIPNVVVTAGKEVIMEVGLEESVENLEEIVVTAKVEKDKANNEMATISARSFSLEEVTRYSGGRNDVSRLAANFAGVNIASDDRNDIVVRGNSPTGVLWRLEGVPIPNPNHFSTLGTTGGPVSALNTNLLKNSDFLTSAFPAEYGNALAGVFDIGFRSGNKDKYEFTAQLAAFSGLEFMAEGPLTKKKESSFLISYRHSFVELADALNLDFGTNSIPAYKDLSLKLDFGNGKAGKFSLFAIGGLSDINFLAAETDSTDFFAQDASNSYVTSRFGVVGLNHRYLIGDKAYFSTTISANNSGNTFKEESIKEDESVFDVTNLADYTSRFTLSSYFNKKYNAKLTTRTGVLLEYYKLNIFLEFRDLETEDFTNLRDFNEGMVMSQAYYQAKYKLNNRLTLNGGLHAQHFSFTNDFVLEPRAALNYNLNNNQTISLGYGLHHQMQPLPTYFIETIQPNGSSVRTNEALDFTRAHHMVLGYDLKLGPQWRLKAETYYQALDKVPVEPTESDFSLLNVGADFVFPNVDSLQNNGTGKNYGIELTIEKFFSDGFYGLVTTSVFDSKYTGSDGVERNTAFNNGYTFNFLFGKEFYLGKSKRNALTFDTKFTTAGGRYYTPFDVELSTFLGEGVPDLDKSFSERYDPYLRLDVKVGYRLNSKTKKFSQQFFLDFQNVTNRQNVFVKRWDSVKNESYDVYQIGFFPDILYRVQF